LVPVEFGACRVSCSAEPDDVAPAKPGPESVSAPATAAPTSIAADIPAVITPAPNHTDNRSTLAPIHDNVFLSPQHHRRLAVARPRNWQMAADQLPNQAVAISTSRVIAATSDLAGRDPK
jgi:hypothetical protein